MGMDRIIEKKKGPTPKQIVLVALGALVIGLIVKMALSASVSVYKTDISKVMLGNVEKTDFKDYISIVGSVAPSTTIYLSADEGGKVQEKLIEEGEMVKKGDVIFRMVNNDLNLQIMNAESQLAYQANELRNTLINMDQQKINNKRNLLDIDFQIMKLKRAYEQNKVLYDEGNVSAEDFTRSREDYEYAVKERELRYEQMVQDSIFRENQRTQMNASLKNMQANLSIVRQRLEDLNVKAPADGQLGTLDIEIGQNIGQGQQFGQLNIIDSYKVTAQVDEHYIDRVKKDLHATFERQERQFSVKVKKVYPEVRDGKFQIDMQFGDTAPDNLRTGQTYHIKLELGQSTESVVIPRGGFFQATGGQWIFVLDPSGKFATRRNIKIGRQNALYYEVLEGLNPGEKVIVSDYSAFGDNDRIEF